jgi:hypothetical protein
VLEPRSPGPRRGEIAKTRDGGHGEARKPRGHQHDVRAEQLGDLRAHHVGREHS